MASVLVRLLLAVFATARAKEAISGEPKPEVNKTNSANAWVLDMLVQSTGNTSTNQASMLQAHIEGVNASAETKCPCFLEESRCGVAGGRCSWKDGFCSSARPVDENQQWNEEACRETIKATQNPKETLEKLKSFAEYLPESGAGMCSRGLALQQIKNLENAQLPKAGILKDAVCGNACNEDAFNQKLCLFANQVLPALPAVMPMIVAELKNCTKALPEAYQGLALKVIDDIVNNQVPKYTQIVKALCAKYDTSDMSIAVDVLGGSDAGRSTTILSNHSLRGSRVSIPSMESAKTTEWNVTSTGKNAGRP